MMLVLEARAPQVVTVRLVQNGVVLKALESEEKGETLRLVAKIMGRAKAHKLSSIAVAMAGGSFSHTRGVAAVGNTLGFVLGVPVLGVRRVIPTTGLGLRYLERRASRLSKKAIVKPAYSGKPNIT